MDIKEWLPIFKVSSEADRDLMKYFMKTQYLSDIVNGDKWLVLGRKGTGKTAIFEYLKFEKPNNINNYIAVALNFSDYPWPIHKMYKESMEGELTAYQKSWYYLFIVQALSKLIEHRENNDVKLSKDLKIVKKLFNEIYGGPFPSIVEVIKSKIKRIQTIGMPGLSGFGIEVDLGEVSFEEIDKSDLLKQEIKRNAFALLDSLEKILISSLENERILIILDQLDEAWLEEEINEYSKILV